MSAAHRTLFIFCLLSSVLLNAQPARVPGLDVQAQAPAETTTQAGASAEPIRVGPYLAIPFSINAAQIPDGWKTTLRIESMPDLGVHLLVPVMSSAGLYGGMNVGFHRVAYVSRPYTAINDSNTRMISLSCFEITPMVALPYAFAGLRIALPMSTAVQSYDGSLNSTNVQDTSGAYTSLSAKTKTLFELVVGGRLPLIVDAQGTLYATAMLSYQLGSAFKDASVPSSLLYDGATLKTSQDPRALSLSIGLAYLFEL